jgi:Di-haem oxidoreductase, putative peroxidase
MLVLMPPRRKVLLCSCLFAALTALGTGLVGIAENSATEAPAGFNTPRPTIFINDRKDTITGRSIVNDRAIGPQAQETIPATENIRTLRATLNTLGDGFVEAIDDSTLIAIAAEQPELSRGRVHGEVVQAPIFEASGQTRVGRFGWKDQHSSLLSFIADAYLNEMGITSRLRPKDVTTVLKTTKDFEDQPDELGLADIQKLWATK